MRTTPFVAAAIAVALVASSALADGDDPTAPPDHPRLAYVATDGTRAELPLVSSHVDAVIRGPIAPDAGVYQLALPTVVGPRYIPGDAVDAAPRGTGTASDTTQVPDASRISPPVAVGTGNAVSVSIDLDAGLPVKQVDSPTHKLAVTKRGDSARTIALATGETAADRDVVITWKVDVSQPTIAALADHDDAHGHVALIVQPPPAPVTAKHAPARELVFV